MQLELGLCKQTGKPSNGFAEADGGRGAGEKRVSAVCLFVQPVCCSALCSPWETSHCLTPIYPRLVTCLLMKNQFNAKVDADFAWFRMADTQMWLFFLPRNSVSLTIVFLLIFYWGKKHNLKCSLLKLEPFHLDLFFGVEALAWLTGRSVWQGLTLQSRLSVIFSVWTVWWSFSRVDSLVCGCQFSDSQLRCEYISVLYHIIQGVSVKLNLATPKD